MPYDLVIKNGSIIDGSGAPAFHADVGISGGKIALIGRIRENGAETIDAEGHVVTPGFIDGHTHMDAQVFWDRIGSSSCYHGVTSVVMGNCGFTLAPCPEEKQDLAIRNLERAEDIARESMQEGINWTWETFPDYLDAVEAVPKGINYAGYIGHSALRTYVMGERAFTEQATEDELAAMCRIVQEAVRAGGIGFSTSRTHRLFTDKPVASAVSDWSEVRAIVNAMGETGAGVFEIAGDITVGDPERTREYHGRIRQLSIESGVPMTWGVAAGDGGEPYWRGKLALLDEVAAAGGRMFAQSHSRTLDVMFSFEARTPFDTWITGGRSGRCRSRSRRPNSGIRPSGPSSLVSPTIRKARRSATPSAVSIRVRRTGRGYSSWTRWSIAISVECRMSPPSVASTLRNSSSISRSKPTSRCSFGALRRI